MDEDFKFKFLTKPAFNFNVPSSRFKLLLSASEEYQILNGKSNKRKEIEGIFDDITSKLENLATRHVGVLLLETFLPQCYDDVFLSHGIKWMVECINIVHNGADSSTAIIDTYRVLNLLFEHAGKFKQLSMTMYKEVIDFFLSHVLQEVKFMQNQRFYMLNCLKTLLLYYHNANCVKLKKGKIEKFLLETVDCTDSSLAIVAGQCIGNTDFLLKFRMLCGTANALLFQLFANVSEVSIPKPVKQLPKGFLMREKKGADVLLTYSSNANRFVNVLHLLEGMLMSDSRVCKVMRVEEVLGVVCRALAINCKNIERGRGTVEHYALLAVLPRLHIGAFNFLSSLVSSYDGVLGFGGLFCQIVVDVLTWTNTPYIAGNIRPFANLRKAACLFLETWVVRAKAASCVDLYAENLFGLLLQDIVQKQETVELQVIKGNSPDEKFFSKELLLNPQANAESCAAALSLICAVIEACGSRVKKHHHVKLQETVVGLLLEVRRKNLEYMPVPLSAPDCRLQLYRVLLALTLHPHGSWPAPLQFALTLFPYGQCDPSNEVASFCLLATTAVRQMVHPSRSNAQFPISMENMQRTNDKLPQNPPTNDVSTRLEAESINSKTLNGTEESTPVSNSGRKARKAKKRKKTVPDLEKEDVNGTESEVDSSVEEREEAVVSSDQMSASKKKKRASVNGLDEEVNGKSGKKKKKKKKPRQSLESSLTDGDISLSSEPLLKKKRGLSESSGGSSDLSARGSILRPSVGNWDVVDLPQKETKKKKKKQKMQTDGGSVDVMPVNDVEQRTSTTGIRSKKKLLSSENSWNVSDSLIHNVSPKGSVKKIVSPSVKTVCPVQKKSKKRVEERENTSGDVPEKDAAARVGKENAGQKKEEAVAKTNEGKQEPGLEVHARKRKEASSKVVSSSRSSAPDVPPFADGSSADEKESSEGESPRKKSHSPAEDAGKTAGGIDTISDSVGTAKEKFQEDKPQKSVKDTKATAESVTNICGDEGKLDCEEKSRDDVPPTPVQKPETLSQVNDTVTIEEIPIHKVESVEEKSKVNSANHSPYADAPVVDLADSDNSCSVISLDSDGKQEQAREDLSVVKESAVNTSFEDGQDPDASTGMDAVVESPSVSLEGTETEAAERGGSGSSEKLNRRGKEGKRDSDSDEEDILTTFVDIVSTDSK